MEREITEEKKTAELFAANLFSLGNPEEAALRIGARPEEAIFLGCGLMKNPEVRRILKRLGKCRSSETEASAGLRRLAFGRINDALELLKDDQSGVSAERLDLFNVAEIKKVKGGGVEIKFFDRLEALERLAEIESRASETSAADSFFNALGRGDGKRSE